MRRPSYQLVCLAGVVIGSLSSFKALNFFQPATPSVAVSDESSDEHAAQVVDEKPHMRPPIGVSLTIDEGSWLRGPGEEWYESQQDLQPGRFSHSDEAADGEGGWIDSQDYYRLRYDEEEEVWAYWHWVSPERLTRGRQDFVQFCSSCHGLDGDGYGRSGQWLRPSPRDFRQNNFKFTKVLQGLPTDEALLRLIKRGLDGTPMLPWDLQDEPLLDIIQYIKSLSPEGEGWRSPFAGIGGVVESGDDPWIGREDEAITKGEVIYHGQAQCMTCHPGYVNPNALPAMLGQPAGTSYREKLFLPVLKESEYAVQGNKVKIIPPDFTFHTVRSGTTTQDLFETIASGIKGTAMPQWKGSLPDEDLWALAHYVQSMIHGYKDKPAERTQLMTRLREGL
ncbi:MAG: mono/diheme cytochrome c family protein [Planctomycetota bacterium]|jgi:mono/diheme cytochrome c family protein